MRNIFIVYMAPGNHEMMVHYEDTIKNKVAQERIFRHVDHDLQNTLRNIFGSKTISVWGSEDKPDNRARFSRMVPGDDIIIVEGNTIKLLGKIASHDL